MKKLMFAAAVAALSTATIADVVSSSVVGYQNKALTGSGKYDFCVATFRSVGKEIGAMTLGDIGVSSGWQSGIDQLKTLTAGGGIKETYTYVTAADAEDWGCPEGWYKQSDVDDEEADLSTLSQNSVSLAMTQGVLLSVGYASTSLVYSGEVLDEDQPIALTGSGKYDFTGNISPVDITLGDIVPDSSWQSGIDQLKTLTTGGGIKEAYSFVNATDAEDWGCPVGWYKQSDIDDEEADLSSLSQNSLEISAGQALLLSVGFANTTITIPSAL